MSRRNTVFYAMHDLGAAGWFGGALMGADQGQRQRPSQIGWRAARCVKSICTVTTARPASAVEHDARLSGPTALLITPIVRS